MKAVQATRFGDPSVLAVAELPDPTPGPGQIAVDVTHAAVGLIDIYLRQGLYRDRPGLPQPPYVPGLEVAGTVRALGEGVTGFAVGEQVVTMSGTGAGGYATVCIADQTRVFSLRHHDIDPALAVSVIPNAIMAHIAVAHAFPMAEGESILIHGAFGGLASTFPGIARQLGASRIVGTARGAKVGAATKLPYDKIVDSADLLTALAGEQFDVIIDPVGGEIRTRSLELLAPFGRMLLVGNASGDWNHAIPSNPMWFGNTTVAGFNAGGYVPAHPEAVPPAAEAALKATAAGLMDIDIDVLPLAEAATAHERMENHTVKGRLVLTTQ